NPLSALGSAREPFWLQRRASAPPSVGQSTFSNTPAPRGSPAHETPSRRIFELVGPCLTRSAQRSHDGVGGRSSPWILLRRSREGTRRGSSARPKSSVARLNLLARLHAAHHGGGALEAAASRGGANAFWERRHGNTRSEERLLARRPCPAHRTFVGRAEQDLQPRLDMRHESVPSRAHPESLDAHHPNPRFRAS